MSFLWEFALVGFHSISSYFPHEFIMRNFMRNSRSGSQVGMAESQWNFVEVTTSGPVFCFLSLAQSKLRLCSANHRPGYWSNLSCDWLSTAWAYSSARNRKRALICCVTSAKRHGDDVIRLLGAELQSSVMILLVISQLEMTKSQWHFVDITTAELLCDIIIWAYYEVYKIVKKINLIVLV